MPLSPTNDEFWSEYNFGVFAQKFLDSIFRGLRHNWKKILQEKKKNMIKFFLKMPQGPTSLEFWPKYHYSVFAWKLVHSIFLGPRNNWWNFFPGKKIPLLKFVWKCPLVRLAKNFDWNTIFYSFAQKHVDSIFSGPRHNWIYLLQGKKKKNSFKFFPQCP